MPPLDDGCDVFCEAASISLLVFFILFLSGSLSLYFLSVDFRMPSM